MIRSAQHLAEHGFKILPCRPRDKRPATLNGVKDASSDPEQIGRWWREEPSYNVAIATGSPSGIFVVDIDSSAAEAELRRLQERYGEFPATVEATTARGRHLYFSMPKMPVRNSASKIAPGVDVRGDGGYVLAPPSVHPSGKLYAWSADCASHFAGPPDWLCKLLTPPQRPDRPRIAIPDRYALSHLVQVIARAQEGERNNITFWAACRAGEMVGSGLINAATAASVITEAAMRAGLPRSEAERTAWSGIRAASV